MEKDEMVVRNANGREFMVRVVRKGGRYGLNDCLVHEKDVPLVQFWDLKHVNKNGFGERGQFVTAYSATELSKHVDGIGLFLHFGIPEWTVDADPMEEVSDLARQLCQEAGR